jgi:hypothetical protein
MIVRINDLHQLQSSCSLSAKVTPIATQLRLTTSMQLVIMVKLWLTITIYTLRTYGHIESKLQLMCNKIATMKYYDIPF